MMPLNLVLAIDCKKILVMVHRKKTGHNMRIPSLGYAL